MAGVTSVRRALRILEILAVSDRAVPLSQIAKQVGLAPSTTHNLLISLVDEGFATNTDGSYRLGPRSASLSSAGAHSLQEVLQATTDRLAVDTGHSSLAVALIGGIAAEVAYSHGSGPVTAGRAPLGNLAPLDLATGRVLLAYEPEAVVVSELRRNRDESGSPLERWREVLAAIRAAGLGLRLPRPDASPRYTTSSIAVPIWRYADKPSWALNCSVPWHLERAETYELGRTLWGAARELTRELGVREYPVAEPEENAVATVYEELALLPVTFNP